MQVSTIGPLLGPAVHAVATMDVDRWPFPVLNLPGFLHHATVRLARVYPPLSHILVVDHIGSFLPHFNQLGSGTFLSDWCLQLELLLDACLNVVLDQGVYLFSCFG